MGEILLKFRSKGSIRNEAEVRKAIKLKAGPDIRAGSSHPPAGGKQTEGVKGYAVAAFLPAMRPKQMMSGMAHVPNRFVPMTSPVTSPAA